MAIAQLEKQNELVVSMEKQFAKLPNLSASVRLTLVTIVPWLALIFGILGLVAGIAAIGLVSVFSPLMVLGGGASAAGSSIITAVLALVQSVLTLIAVPALFNRKFGGWMLMFWSEALGVVGAALSLSVMGVLVSLIGFYLLFQVKSHYK